MIGWKRFSSFFTRRSEAARIAVLAVLLSCSATPLNAEFKNHISLGYDSFIDRFTILEEDTVESIQEFYTSIGNNLYLHKNRIKTELRNIFRYGNQSVDDYVEGHLFLRPRESMRIDLRSNLHWKHFQDGSDYAFGNDYIQSNTVLKFGGNLNDRFRITSKNRFEIINYQENTEFDYDYRYFDTGLELEGGSYFKRFVRVGAFVGFKETPDTTALSYRRTVSEIETQLMARENILFHLTVTGDRRDYRENIRSSYWSVTSYADLSVNTINGTLYSLRVESELAIFDEPTTTFFDTYFFRGGFKVKVPISSLVSVFFEPRLARMFCSDFEEERYWEGSAVFGIDVFGRDEFWLTASYEPGYRDYLAAVNEIYSDFYLNRLSLMGSIAIPGSMTLNIFITHDPERHARRDDDFSITLVSTEVTKRF